MAELLKLKIGVPEIIALQFATGKIIESTMPNAPNQVMFTLCDGRRTFLPLSAADRIREAGIQAMQTFEILKKTADDFQVRPVYSAASTASTVPAATAQTAAPHSNNGYHNPAPLPPPPPPPAVSPAIQPPALHPATTTCTKVLASALIASIDAYLLAADYARAKGIQVSMDFDINAEDMRASATTLMIECFKREGGAR